MNMLNLPGFGAEFSIPPSQIYHGAFSVIPPMRGETVIPAQSDCISSRKCSECVSLGPSIFSLGRQFCINTACHPTHGGGCRCRVISKGFVGCKPPIKGGVALPIA